jgi:hypothetical protein
MASAGLRTARRIATWYRARRWDTRADEIELQIPKIRQGSYFPSILELRWRYEQALLAVVQQAYVCGVSTRRVDQLVESLGLRVSKSEVSRICGALDEHVDAFRNRPLEGRYPYVFLDAKVEKVRDGGRVVNKALVIAHGVHETGRREILDLDVGEAETEAFWTEFLRGLVGRGLVGVQLAISDAHAGLKAAIAKVLRVRLAAPHRSLPQRLPRPRAARSARPAGGVDPADLQRRLARPRDATGSAKRSRISTGVSPRSRHARGCRARHPRVLRVPGRALAQAQKHKPARALQQGDRPAHRRRRHLPRRPRPGPLGRGCSASSRTMVVGRPGPSLGGIDLSRPRGASDHTDNKIKREAAQLQTA